MKSQSLSILNYLLIKFKKKLHCDSLKFCIILKSIMIVAAKLLEFYSITQQSLNNININTCTGNDWDIPIRHSWFLDWKTTNSSNPSISISKDKLPSQTLRCITCLAKETRRNEKEHVSVNLDCTQVLWRCNKQEISCFFLSTAMNLREGVALICIYNMI